MWQVMCQKYLSILQPMLKHYAILLFYTKIIYVIFCSLTLLMIVKTLSFDCNPTYTNAVYNGKRRELKTNHNYHCAYEKLIIIEQSLNTANICISLDELKVFIFVSAIQISPGSDGSDLSDQSCGAERRSSKSGKTQMKIFVHSFSLWDTQCFNELMF